MPEFGGSAIRAILFDWGDTLIRPPGITTDPGGHFRCVEHFYCNDLTPQVHARGGTLPEWSAFRALYEQATMELVNQTLDTGREHSFAMRVANTLCLTGQPGLLDTAQCTELGAALGRYIVQRSVPIPGARDTVERLARHLSTGLLSNYPHAPAVRESLANAGILPHLHEVLISAEIGWSKPSMQAFDAAIDALGLDPTNILFVGDDLENDMRGARSMGMRTAWLPRADQRDAGPDHATSIDIRLDSITQLIDMLEQHTGTSLP